MKNIVLLCLLLITRTCSSQEETRVKYDYTPYKLITGYCSSGALIKLFKGEELIYKSCGGEGEYDKIDTTDINNDGVVDFIFSLLSDDYFTLYALVSFNINKYNQIRFRDYFYGDVYCNVNNKNLHYFYLKDINNDGKKEVLINVLLDSLSQEIQVTSCTDTLNLNK